MLSNIYFYILSQVRIVNVRKRVTQAILSHWELEDYLVIIDLCYT